jgi:negative regulator of sigma E activity
MSEQIREQVSAFLDGELPGSETELLLKRLTRDGELRESFGRYALIGEAIRGAGGGLLTKGFTGRVNLAIDGEALPAGGHVSRVRAPRWWPAWRWLRSSPCSSAARSRRKTRRPPAAASWL